MARYEIDNTEAPIDFQGSDIVLRTLQNVKNLLMCRMGEVPYDRYRGIDPAIFDLPFGELQDELLPELDRVMMWEPDVEVVDADAELLENGETRIRAIIEITIGENGEGEADETDEE